jgi:hypothetical protein
MRTGTTKRDRKAPKPACRQEPPRYTGEKRLGKILDRLYKMEAALSNAIADVEGLDLKLHKASGNPPRGGRGKF